MCDSKDFPFWMCFYILQTLLQIEVPRFFPFSQRFGTTFDGCGRLEVDFRISFPSLYPPIHSLEYSRFHLGILKYLFRGSGILALSFLFTHSLTDVVVVVVVNCSLVIVVVAIDCRYRCCVVTINCRCR